MTIRWKLAPLVVALGIAACSEVDESVLMDRAQKNIEQGKYSAAIIDLKTVLKENASNERARALIGDAYLEKEMGEQAEKEFRKAEKITEGDQYESQLIRSYLLQRKNDEAVSVLDGIKKKDAEVYYYYGVALLGLGEIEKSKQKFQESLKHDSSYLDAKIGLARVLLSANDAANAEKYIGEVLAQNAEHSDALHISAKLAMLSADYEKAAKQYERLVNIPILNERPADAFTIKSEYARLLLAQGNAEKASIYADQLLKLSENHPLPNYLKASIAFNEQAIDQADDYLKKVIKHAPDHLPSLYLMAQVKFAAEEFQQADYYLSKVVAKVPQNVAASKLMVMTRLKLGKPDDALAALQPLLSASPNDPDVIRLKASAQAASGEGNSAINSYKQVLKMNPDMEGLRLEMASVYLREDDYGNADRLAKEEMERFGKSFKAESLRLVIKAKSGAHDQAISLSNNLIAQYPDEPRALLLKGELLQDTGNKSEAKRVFDELIDKFPDFDAAKKAVVRGAVRQGDMETAKLYLEELSKSDDDKGESLIALAEIAFKSKDEEQGIMLLNQARNENPNHLKPRIILARYYLSKDEFPQAKQIIAELAKIDGERIEVLLLQGDVAQAEGKYNEAISYFEKASYQYPDIVGGHYGLGRAYLSIRNLPAAKKSLMKVVAINEKVLPAQLDLFQIALQEKDINSAKQHRDAILKVAGSSYLENLLAADIAMLQKAYKKADSLYEKALSEKMTSEVLMKRFRALLASGKQDVVVSAGSKWLTENPDDFRVRLMVAIEHQKRGESTEAMRHYERIVEDQPNNIGVLNNLAWIYLENGDKRALEYARKASRSAPDVGTITDTLGWVEYKMGDKREAERLLQEAVRQSPKEADIQYHLAVVLNDRGDRVGAKKALETALKSKGVFTEKNKAEALYNSIK